MNRFSRRGVLGTVAASAATALAGCASVLEGEIHDIWLEGNVVVAEGTFTDLDW